MAKLPVIQPGAARRAGQPPIFAKIGIVGLGLIGGSIALAARELWPASLVIGVDNKDVLETAMRLHAIDVAADDLDRARRGRPRHSRGAGPAEHRAARASSTTTSAQPAVVTDTGSTKREIVAAAAALPPRFTFIGGHPLGGAAQGGLEHARPDLFRRPAVAVHAGRRRRAATPLEKLLGVRRGRSAPSRASIGVDAHDRLLAFLSHLPQLTASALMQVVGDAVGARRAWRWPGAASPTRRGSPRARPTSGRTSPPPTPTRSARRSTR